jgi:NitT/TauT family transport system ATP-binding protein
VTQGGGRAAALAPSPSAAGKAPAGGPAGAPIVRLAGVGKRFANGVTALSGLDLTVHQGEFVSLLGPSGCGKSTALRIIAGLAAPSTGTVEWTRDGNRAAPRASHDIGFVFQEPTLMPWAPVFANVWLPLRLKGVSRTAARADVMQALSLVGLERFAEAYPRELSGGMKMRVSIARALVTQPRILLMDEPFAALDEITRQRLNDDLLSIKARLGTTVVFVTHSVFESTYLSTRIVVMAARPGRIIETIDVDAPLPRDQRFRTSVLYNAICEETSHALLAAIATAGDSHL